MNCPVPRTTSKLGAQKVPLEKLITVILVTSIALALFFGWYYLRGENPVELLSSKVPIERPSPEYLFTLYGTTEKRFRNPSATAVNKQKIYVADSLNRRIAVFNYNGKYLAQFGSTGQGKLKFPFGLVFVDDEIFVTDIGTRKVQVFNLEGKFLRYFGEGLVRVPTAIFYRDKKFYILDAALTKVTVLDKDGKKLISFGKRGGGEGELYYPFSINVTEMGEIYVADSNNNRIQVFNQQGNLVKILSGKNTNGEGGYAVPRGLAFDKAGNLYTTELLGPGVAITDKQGRVFLRSAAAGPSENGIEDKIKYPTAVFIDDNQRLYVTEYGNSRILVYKLK